MVLFVVSLGRCTVSYTVDLFFISLGAEAQVKGGEVYARILGGSLCNISYFKSDTISNLQKTGVHFTNFCENPIYHKKSQPRMCKISQSQFCSWGEGSQCKNKWGGSPWKFPIFPISYMTLYRICKILGLISHIVWKSYVSQQIIGSMCKISLTQFCIKSEKLICKFTSPKIKLARINYFAGGELSAKIWRSA